MAREKTRRGPLTASPTKVANVEPLEEGATKAEKMQKLEVAKILLNGKPLSLDIPPSGLEAIVKGQGLGVGCHHHSLPPGADADVSTKLHGQAPLVALLPGNEFIHSYVYRHFWVSEAQQLTSSTGGFARQCRC
eukprot:5127041-Amphidinium_carterae.2